MKRKLVAVAIVVPTVAVAGVAWALIGGIINVPAIAQGFIPGSGAQGCQTSGVTFDIPDPTWDNTAGTYVVTTVDYSGITANCVSLGTADLNLTLTGGANPNPIATGNASNMGATSGTLTLDNPVEFDLIATANFNFIVKDV